MRKLVGKRVVEAVCPLCSSQYILSDDEVMVEKNKKKVNFYCEECDRRVRLDLKDRTQIRERFIPNWFNWEGDDYEY